MGIYSAGRMNWFVECSMNTVGAYSDVVWVMTHLILPVCPFYLHKLTKTGIWIRNYIHNFIWDVITPPCPNFNDDLAKTSLRLWHGWVITSYCFAWMYSLIIAQSLRLTHWGRVTHICVSKLTIIGSDNGLSPGRRQAIIWTNAGILLIRTLGTNFSEILGKIHSFSFKKMHFKMSSAKGRLFSLGLNELIGQSLVERPQVIPSPAYE